MSSIYDFELTDGEGRQVRLKDFEGKVLLIVNTATDCGFTPQYEALEAMYEKYHRDGLEIIDVPCDQFAGQAPGTDEEIREFCKRNYHTQFAQMKKSDVNGENELPLYTYLKSCRGFEGFGKGPKAMAMGAMVRTIDKDYKNSPSIKWNFTKFLADRQGFVAARFEPTAAMAGVERQIKALL